MSIKERLIQHISVVCIGNICRSPMGEALLRAGVDAREHKIKISSAGLGTINGQPADPIAIKLMAERDLDISGYRSNQFSPSEAIQSDLILVMSTNMRDSVVTDWPLLQGRVFRLGHWGNYDIDDPHRRGERAFRKSLKLIDEGVARWLEKIS